MRILGTLFIILFEITGFSQTEVFPKDFDTLTYTSVMFSFPEKLFAKEYLIEIVDESSRVNYRYNTNTNLGIINSLEFNVDYKWRYSETDHRGQAIDWSPYLHFRIETPKRLDVENYQFSTGKKSRSNTQKALFLMDYGQCAVNRAGKAMFYIPELKGVATMNQVRDLKLTNTGTFTAIIDSIPYEFDLSGRILWTAPDEGKLNGEARENFHHDFTKLDNGNYLVLGTDNQKVEIDGQQYDVAFDTALEFDKEGQLVWSWNSKEYFTVDFLRYLHQNNERPNTTHIGLHANACSTDGTNVYIGFRDISRILVIDKKSKKVVSSYGGYGPSKEIHSATGFFRRQHDVELLKDGNIAVVNNDSVMDPTVVSSLVIFSRIDNMEHKSNKLMDFKFNYDSLTNGKSPKTGNLQELVNGNLFVNMGSLNRCFEITRDGEVVWDMFISKYDTNHHMVMPFPQYRIHSYSSLYPFVFNANITSLKKTRKESAIGITIHNIGSENDAYTIYLVDSKNRKHELRKIEVLSGNSEVIIIEMEDEEELNISVRSESCGVSKHLKSPLNE